MRNRLALLALCLAMLVAAPGASAQTSDGRGVDPARPSPLVGESWYVNKAPHPAWLQYQRYAARVIAAARN